MQALGWRWVKAGTIIAVFFLTLGSFGMPPWAGEDAAQVDFSAQRAMVHVEELARDPRSFGSSGHVRAQDYLERVLAQWELTVKRQSALVQLPGYWPGGPGEVNVHNLLVRLPGRRSDGAVLLVAHYDSVPLSPGAGDNGVGVATSLETVRALGGYGPLARDVIVLFSDGEELGLLGATTFLEQHPWARDVAAVVNLDGRGNQGPVLLMEAVPSQLIHTFRRVVTHPWAFGMTSFFYRRMGGDTDFSVFRQAGLPGYNLTFVHGVGAYHQPRDRVEELDPRLLQHMGAQCLALVRELGDAIDVPVPAGVPRQVVYFTLPGARVVAYDARWNWLLTGVVLGGLLVLRWGEERLGWLQVMLASAACMATGGAVIVGMTLVLQHSLPDHLVQDPAIGIILLFGIGGKAAFNFHWLYSQWRRFLPGASLSAGMRGSLACLLVMSAFWFVDAHYLLAWPLLALVLVERLVPSRHRLLAIFMVTTVSFFALWLPIIYLGYIILTWEQPAPILAAVLLGSSWWYLARAPLE